MNALCRTFSLGLLALVAATASAGPDNAAGQTVVLGLQGYSPVSYIEHNRAEPGSPQFAAEYDGVTYFFTSAAQRQKFLRDAQRYLPAYGGWCAYGCAVNGKFTPDPTNFSIVDGRTHLFLRNEQIDTRTLWEKGDVAALRGKADRFWKAQTESRAYSRARNLPASGVAIDGFSPVSYFTVGKAEPGDPRYQVEHNGATYFLTSDDQVKLFKANPDRYEPAFGGWCAFGMAVEDKFPVDPTKFKIVDGRLMLFLNNADVDALELWQKGDEAEFVRKADTHWKKVAGM